MTTPIPGQVAAALSGYDIGAELGRGGFGSVLAGRHRLIGRDVAVKVLLDSAARDGSDSGESAADDLRSRFLSEARVLAGLDHPHVVRIYDYVEHDGLCLLVMEQLTGGSLRGRAAGGLDPRAACAISLAAATALDTAHRRGVLHRDVKPDNLLFAADGMPKVTDFGIAKIVETTAATTTGLIGTPRYMAPEQISGTRLGPGTDLYALGVVLYELLTGRTVFPRGLPVPALLHHHLSVPPQPMPEVPAPLASVVLSMLAKEPADRPADGHELACQLAAAATAVFGPGWLGVADIPVRLPDDVLTAAGGEARHGSGPGTPLPATRRRRRIRPGRRRLAVVAGAVAVCVLAVTIGLVVALRGDDAPKAAYAGERRTLSDVSALSRIALGKDGSLYVVNPGDGAGTGEVLRLRPDGTLSRFAGVGPAPSASASASPNASPNASGATATATATAPPSTPPADGAAAVSIRLREPHAVAVGPDDSVYVADYGGDRVLRITPDGRSSTYAGVGTDGTGFTGDSGRATEAALRSPAGLAVGPDGSLYITEDYRVRKVTPDGLISTVAGGYFRPGSDGDGGPAKNASLYSPNGIAVAADGTVYVSDRTTDTVRKITGDGKINLVAGTRGTLGGTGDNGPAGKALLNTPLGLAMGSDGSLYIADASNDRVRKVSPDGIITTVAGSGSYRDGVDGALATEASLQSPAGVLVDPSGALYVTLYSTATLVRIDPRDHIVHTVLAPAAS